VHSCTSQSQTMTLSSLKQSSRSSCFQHSASSTNQLVCIYKLLFIIVLWSLIQFQIVRLFQNFIIAKMTFLCSLALMWFLIETRLTLTWSLSHEGYECLEPGFYTKHTGHVGPAWVLKSYDGIMKQYN